MTIIARLRQLVEAADPEGAVTVRVAWLAQLLEGQPDEAADAPPPTSWRQLLWTAPPEVPLGVTEIGEALNWPRSTVYRHTMPSARERLPVQRLDGELVVLVGDLRRWVSAHLQPDQHAKPRRRVVA